MRFQGRTIRLPRLFRKEYRSSGYSDSVVRLLTSQAAAVATDPQRTGVVEAAAGIWARAFASVTVTPDAAADVLTPSVMAMIGRELIRNGEALFRVSVRNGRRHLTPATSWEVSGGLDPSSWRYHAQMSGPEGDESRTLGWDEVAFVAWATEPNRPFRGLSPLSLADRTGKLAGRLEESLGDEAGTPRGYLMPVPAVDEVPDGETDPLADMRADLKKLAGGLSVVETTSAGFGEGRGAAPQSDWKAQRIGPNPPEALCILRGDVRRDILAACGVSPAMLADRSDGTARRESYRQFVHLSAAPVGRIVAREFATKLDLPGLTFDWSGLMAGDITGKARAFQSLVKGGMDVERAAALSGLLAS